MQIILWHSYLKKVPSSFNDLLSSTFLPLISLSLLYCEYYGSVKSWESFFTDQNELL